MRTFHDLYLLDVNVLLALGYAKHVHHWRAMEWLAQCAELHAPAEVPLATCPITELGFVRIASSSLRLESNLDEAQAHLQRIKSRFNMTLLPDDVDARWMPLWVRKSKQTTDGHLLTLAQRYCARFVTLDENIPGALLIPELPGPPMYFQ